MDYTKRALKMAKSNDYKDFKEMKTLLYALAKQNEASFPTSAKQGTEEISKDGYIGAENILRQLYK